jgi:hypothetical protein
MSPGNAAARRGNSAVGEAGVAQILDRIQNLADVGQSNGGVVAIGDDEIAILLRLACLIVGVDLIVQRVVLDRALGAVGVRGGQSRADIFEADAVVKQRGGVELDAHGGQGAAVDVDIADA